MTSTDESHRIICRMIKAGDDVLCYFHTYYSTCYASLGSSEFTNTHGYKCQRLRIVNDCTVSWVPYIARDPIPPRAVTAGHMANGSRVYVTKFSLASGASLSGHYVEGTTDAIGALGGTWRSNTMMMMVVL